MMTKGIKKVLITDDSAIVRKRLTAMLSSIVAEGNTSYAEYAREAINSIQKLRPDASMLDMRMPGGSGINSFLEIKRSNQTLPAIALTDYLYRQYRRKYADSGADFLVNTSTEFDDVTAVLRRPWRKSRC
jgi:DNA-binding NarL/FixJ family response regulator